ncbi:MAG: hypothetical protein NT027_10840, partial [Proteobacteria bacterium]|nr:hypothetical protein [Pseudomonadota bacterium]
MSEEFKSRMDWDRFSSVAKDITDEDLHGAHAGDFSSDMKSDEQLEQYIANVASSVSDSLKQSVETLTPWFFNNMPKIYYQTTPRAEKVQHLQALMTSHLLDTKQIVSLWDASRTKVTYMGPGGEQDVLLEVAAKVSDFAMKMGSIYVSRDNRLFVSSFSRGSHVAIDFGNARITEKLRLAKEMMLKEFSNEEKEIQHYLDHLDNEFVMYATAARILLTYRMVRYMKSHEGAHTFFEPVEDRPTARVTLGIKNASAGEVIHQTINLLNRYGVCLTRCFTVTFSKGYESPISIIHLHIASLSGEKINVNAVPMIKLNKALRTMGWVDNDEFSNFLTPQYA